IIFPSQSYHFILILSLYPPHSDLHSFPTRRSSDLHYNNVEEISSFVVSGHANSGPYGQDLVCAAVSAVTFGAGNAVLEITNAPRSEEHTSELQSRFDLVCRLLLEKKNMNRQDGEYI